MIVKNNYVEIMNGLFQVERVIFNVDGDDPEEFTFNFGGVRVIRKEDLPGMDDNVVLVDITQIPQSFTPIRLQEIVHSLRSQDIEVIESTEIRRTRNEQIWADLRSEQEILQYLDRISEEDEHNNNI